jgi:DNA-binding response OmpR family regulator
MSGAPFSSQRPHLLVLSDDRDLSSFLSEGLILGGFWVSIIASGIQAIEVFRLRGFDLVIVDATLRGMDALEVVRRLRLPTPDRPLGVDVPILIVAANANEMDAKAAALAGANRTLYPPIVLEELIPELFRAVLTWRQNHPGRPWADEAAQSRLD